MQKKTKKKQKKKPPNITNGKKRRNNHLYLDRGCRVGGGDDHSGRRRCGVLAYWLRYPRALNVYKLVFFGIIKKQAHREQITTIVGKGERLRTVQAAPVTNGCLMACSGVQRSSGSMVSSPRTKSHSARRFSLSIVNNDRDVFRRASEAQKASCCFS